MIASTRFGFVGLFVAVLSAFALPDANGQPPYILTSNNSMLAIDPSIPDTVYDWRVEGVDHLKEFSNWYRVGGGREFPLSTVPVSNIDNSMPDRLIVTHRDLVNPRFEVEVTYGVNGGAIGSGYSTMGECVTIRNLRSGLLDFHLFEYMNLDLDTTPGDDQAYRSTATRLNQDDIGTAGTTFNVAYGTSSHHEIAYSPSIRSRLNDNFTNTLQDIPATTGTTIGPGDMEFALQYDIALTSFGSHTICKDCELQMVFIPEPMSGVLALIAGMAIGRIRTRRGRA